MEPTTSRASNVTFDGVGNTLVAGAMGSVGGGSIVKNGTGTTTFTALNTYGGPRTVNGGLLLVNGDQLNANGLTTVNSGGALGGSGILEPPWSSTQEETLRLEVVEIRREF